VSSAFKINLETTPDDNDVRVLLNGIHDHNMQHSGDREAEYLAIFLRDQTGEVVGGVYGWTAFGWLKIDVLWVKENLRGQGFGKQLLAEAEAEGIRRGCKYATLDSFSFQAPELYKKHGYEEFAVLDNIAGNQTWHFLKKDLT
jgi:ribosomal protein S18 acetylase RimI-like enzyme